MNGTTHTSERALEGYFYFHRLFIWACQTYPNILPKLEKRAKDFVMVPEQRLKSNTPNVGEWLAYLTVSTEATWNRVSQAYLVENFERNVMWYLKEDASLKISQPGQDSHPDRLGTTFGLTQVSRNLLAFQVLLLGVARPSEM